MSMKTAKQIRSSRKAVKVQRGVPAIFVDISTWWNLVTVFDVSKRKEIMRHAWPVEEGGEPTLVFARKGGQAYGTGIVEHRGDDWGILGPTDPVITEWIKRQPYDGGINIAQLLEEAGEVFEGMRAETTTPPLWYDDLNGAFVGRLRPKTDANKSNWMTSKAGMMVLGTLASLAITVFLAVNA